MACEISDIRDKIPGDAVFFPSSQVSISAPAAHVWQVAIDTDSWPQWNSWCPQVEVTPPPSSSPGIGDEGLMVGGTIVLHVRMSEKGGLTKAPCRITEIVTPGVVSNGQVQSGSECGTYRACWGPFGLITWGLRATRTLEVEGSGESESCVFRTWEWQAGPLARIVKMMFGTTIQNGFHAWANDLKSHAEKTWVQKQQKKNITVV